MGKTGDEVRRFCNRQDLPAFEDIFWTNLYREFVHKDYVYTEADLAKDEPELLEELRRVRPQVLITLGRHSTRYFLGDVDMEDVHAIPWKAQSQGRDVVVFPIFHPAAGFHNPDIQGYIAYGFQQLGLYLTRGDPEPRTLFEDSWAGKETYGERVAPPAVESTSRPAIDTEGWAHRPWSLQVSHQPGHADLVRATRLDLLRTQFDGYVRLRPRITYHNALHDLWVIQELAKACGSPFDPATLPFDDTMVMAYLLQVEPKGLKSLGIRYNNMRMQSFADIVREPAHLLALDYLTSLLDLEEWDWASRRATTGLALCDTGRRLKVLPSLPKTTLHKAVERCLRSPDPRALWEKQDAPITATASARVHAMPDATLDYVPAETAIVYGCRDADCTVRLRPQLEARLDAMGLRGVYELELSTYPMLLRMMQVGMLPDLPHFAALGIVLGGEIQTLQRTLATLTGVPAFNANSGDQVDAYLFGTLGLPGGKLTPSRDRYSTNDKILEGLEHEYGTTFPALALIRAYRETYKLKHTFVDRLPEFVDRWPHDGRVHTTLRTTSVVTGRLAASDPNMLAQPERGTWAWAFKRGWIAGPGHVVTNHDESQVELRVLAHLSQDPVMLAVFRGQRRNPDGSLVDLHANLAQRIFGVAPAQQDPDQHRYPAKAINFGLPMGMQAQGLTVELRKNGVMVDEDDAQHWIDDTMALYAGVPVYQAQMVAEARRHGFVRCLSGRIRYIGGIRSPHAATRAEAERFSYATPIQEGAQTIMKHVEVSVWRDILVPWKQDGRYIEPLLQVHDSLKLEVEEGLVQELHPLLVHAMTESYPALSVPLAVEGKWGYNYGEMETL